MLVSRFGNAVPGRVGLVSSAAPPRGRFVCVLSSFCVFASAHERWERYATLWFFLWIQLSPFSCFQVFTGCKQRLYGTWSAKVVLRLFQRGWSRGRLGLFASFLTLGGSWCGSSLPLLTPFLRPLQSQRPTSGSLSRFAWNSRASLYV